jgi:hypothetical protein
MFSFSGRGVMAGLVVAAFLVTGNASGQEVPTVTDPSKTIYGERSARAPRELDVFAFLIGKWDGRGRTRLPDGKMAEYPVAWVGRSILDGTAIADEMHGPYPDGTRSRRVDRGAVRHGMSNDLDNSLRLSSARAPERIAASP